MRSDAEFRSAACPAYEVLLEDYLAGELKSLDAQRVTDHLAKCAGCREAFDDAVGSARLLHAAGPAPEPGPAFSRDVMARIYAAEQERTVERAKFWQPFVFLGWRFAATATLALAMLVSYEVGWGRHLQPKVVAVRLNNVTDLFSPDPSRTPANRDEVMIMLAEDNHGHN